MTEADPFRPGTIAQVGLSPNRLDVLTGIGGVGDFDSAWEQRVEHEVEDVPIRSWDGPRW